VIKTLTEVLPLIKRPTEVTIFDKIGEAHDTQLTETLVSRVNFTDRLFILTLSRINLTAKSAGIIAHSLYQCSGLNDLSLPYNPLGDGVSVLTQHLSCTPNLYSLNLDGVKMTKKQVYHLNAVVRQSKIRIFNSKYHDNEGNPRAEHKWPSEDYWQKWPWDVPSHHLNQRTSRSLGHQLSQGTRRSPG